MNNFYLFLLIIGILSSIPFIVKLFLNKKREGNWLNKLLNILSVLFFLLLLSSILLSFQNLYFRGYKTHNFILIITCSMFTINYLFTFFGNKYWKILAGIILTVSILTTSLVSYINLKNYSSDLWYENSSYRIEDSILLSKPYFGHLPDFYVKKGIVEKKVQLKKNENTIYKNGFELGIDRPSDVYISDSNGYYFVIFEFEKDVTIKTLAEK